MVGMRKLLIALFSFILGMALFLWVVNTIGWRRVVEILQSTFSFSEFVTLLLVTVGIVGVGILRWKVILKSLGHDVPFLALIPSYLVGFCISFVAPMIVFGGEVFRAFALQSAKGVPTGKGVASAVIERFVEFTISFFVIVAGVLTLLAHTTVLPPHVLLLLVAGVSSLGAFIFFFYIKSFRKESILKIFFHKWKNNYLLEGEKEVFQFFRLTNMGLWKALGLSLMREALAFLRTWLIVIFLGKFLSFFALLSVLGFYLLSVLSPFPGALGIHDTLQAFVFDTFQSEAAMGAAFALIVRILEGSIALVGVFMLFPTGTQILHMFTLKKIEKLFARKHGA